MLLCALLALAPALPAATAQDPKPAELQAILALTIDPGFEDEWYHSRSAHGLKIRAVDQVVRGQRFQVCALAFGYATGPKGSVDLRYDAKVTRPDGKPYFEEKDLELQVGEGLRAGNVLLAKQALGVSFDPPDACGEYTFTIELHDALGKRSASANQRITLVEFPEPKPFKDGEELGQWMTEYPTSPAPLRAFDGLARAAADGMLGGDDSNFPLRVFFCTLLRENAYLEPLLLERFPKLEPPTRLAVFEVLAGTEFDAKPFLEHASKDERQLHERALKALRPDPLSGPIRDAHQLDEIWGTYFATGRFAPIERMVTALSLEEQLGGNEKHAGEIVLEGAARWSLKSNLRHPRIKAYCEWMLERGKLDEKDAEALKELMKE